MHHLTADEFNYTTDFQYTLCIKYVKDITYTAIHIRQPRGEIKYTSLPTIIFIVCLFICIFSTLILILLRYNNSLCALLKFKSINSAINRYCAQVFSRLIIIITNVWLKITCFGRAINIKYLSIRVLV